MNRRSLLATIAALPVAACTPVPALAAQQSMPTTWDYNSPSLSPAEYRDELERQYATDIVVLHEWCAEGREPISYLSGQNNGYALALRLLGGYGWQNFDITWARHILATKGQPKLAGVSWGMYPGGPVHDDINSEAA